MSDYTPSKRIDKSGVGQNTIALAANYDLPDGFDRKASFRTFRKTRTSLVGNSTPAYEETFSKMYAAFSHQIQMENTKSDDQQDVSQESQGFNYFTIHDFDVSACKAVSEFFPKSEITVVLGKLTKENFSPDDNSKPNYYNYFKTVLFNGNIKRQQIGHYDIDSEYLDEESLVDIPENQYIIDREDMKAMTASLAEIAAGTKPTLEDIRSKEIDNIIDHEYDDSDSVLDFDKNL